MRALAAIALVALAAPAGADDLMEDCEPGDSKGTMRCIHRNGLCVAMTIDGQPTKLISRESRRRILGYPDMDDVCWELAVPVSAQFRVEARGGGLEPGFVGAIESLGAIVQPLADYDPEFDGNRIDPLYGFELEADGYRDGTWQLTRREHFQTAGSGTLSPGEYVVTIRVHGEDNWDKQAVLLRIDPALQPSAEKLGTK